MGQWPQYITTMHASGGRNIGLCTACYNVCCLLKKCWVLGPEFLSCNSNPLHGEHTHGPTALPLWDLLARRTSANMLMFMMLAVYEYIVFCCWPRSLVSSAYIYEAAKANILVCKQGKISGPSQFLTAVVMRMGCWQWHDFMEEEGQGLCRPGLGIYEAFPGSGGERSHPSGGWGWGVRVPQCPAY